MKNFIMILAGIFLLSGCVAKRYLLQSQQETATLRADSTELANSNSTLRKNISSLNDQIASLQKNIDDLTAKVSDLKSQNSQLGQQTAEQQNKLSQSEQSLQQQKQKLEQLQSLLNQQKQASEELKNKMSEALKGFNSNELSVYNKDGKVYVSLSEQLLFPSGSAVVNPKGVDALSKLAAVLNLNNDVAVNIEGHTDSIPIRGRYQDNWDLSTARANAIVRILVNNYKVDPTRVISSGHSYYEPVASNSTPDGRAKNRRTDIILSPKLDEMYKLLGM
ncbi:flagellar motor protein MotB [Hanamia caeni]|jgi:chemotaxis protein MotB|uniref:Flagellar motor protein MotB n=1 Tax=Hanamia caeni TaxID=2294116 RepID=A0A3M9NE05_9BACT|nr:flagellar motor protein MotB [Hanamia caeni]RNI35675.1 flagellar motor protein MotB [Hanamia caeni]